MEWFHLFQLWNLWSQSNINARIDVSSCPRRWRLEVYMNCRTLMLYHIFSSKPEVDYKDQAKYCSTMKSWTVFTKCPCVTFGLFLLWKNWKWSKQSRHTFKRRLRDWSFKRLTRKKNALLLAINRGMRICEAAKGSGSNMQTYYAIISTTSKLNTPVISINSNYSLCSTKKVVMGCVQVKLSQLWLCL